MAVQPSDSNIVGSVSIGNTTVLPLGADGVFSGLFEDIKDVAFKSISVFADVASAVDGLKFQWSTDGVNPDFTEATSVQAGVGRGFALTPRARYFRMVYVNGPAAQTIFRLAVVYHSSGTGLITRPLSKNLTDDNFAQTVRAVLTGKRADGTYMSLQCTDDGRLKVKVLP